MTNVEERSAEGLDPRWASNWEVLAPRVFHVSCCRNRPQLSGPLHFSTAAGAVMLRKRCISRR